MLSNDRAENVTPIRPGLKRSNSKKRFNQVGLRNCHKRRVINQVEKENHSLNHIREMFP
jgi:hypothetical protein